MKPLLVGLAPGTKDAVGKPAFSTDCSSRRRLQQFAGVDDLETYFNTLNLVPRFLGNDTPALTQAEVVRNAESLLEMHRVLGGIVVTLGRLVQRALFPAAFGKNPETMEDYELQHRTTRLGYGAWVLPLPHPSGLCREWNDPLNVGRASEALRRTMQAREVDC